MKHFIAVAITATLATLSGCSATNTVQPLAAKSVVSAAVEQEATGLRVATWNTEHLAFPIDSGCRPRTATELSALKVYAQQLNADVVALQEVASKQAVAMLFPESDWQLILSSRPNSESYECRDTGYQSTQQKVAFAIRKGLKVLETEQFAALAQSNPGLRYGLGITLESAFGPIKLLNVHLKSGCFVDDYRKHDSKACNMLAEQVTVLDNWVEKHEQQGTPYVILGDFNHRLSAPYNHLRRVLTTNQDTAPASVNVVTTPVIGCHPRYPAPIDHILLGQFKQLETAVTANTQVWPYKDMQEDAMLSDHCAISVTLSASSQPLSNGVTWLTKSKEYQLLTKAIYRQASDALGNSALPSTPWVVMMDVDETVLDNSAYQVNREAAGKGYTAASWEAWVKMEQAGLVPGVADFINKALSAGAKLALVTNRNKQLDKHTWANLLAQGLPLTPENTCLMGRSAEDKKALTRPQIVNDKDLRRQQITQGSSDCFAAGAGWQQPHHILMQIGDNIEDINGTTQEDADPDALLQRWGKDIVILPNSMYGSW